MSLSYSIVVPTVGRPQLGALLASVRAACAAGPRPVDVVVVDDRPVVDERPNPPLDLGSDPVPDVRVLRTGGRGPAAARNTGWRSVRTEWVAFLDDDVVVPGRWAVALEKDLATAGPGVGGVQGRIVVPLPRHRPTDLERNTAGLESAAWATADMAYRRTALEAVHGFDERFPRAYREDADLALRVRAAGWDLRRGVRYVEHPVRPADGMASVRAQAGNADDALLRTLHGRDWRRLTAAGKGRMPWHVATVAAGVTALGGTLAAAVRPGARHAGAARVTAALSAAAWVGLTGAFAVRRLAPGPRPGDEGYGPEVRRMIVTSSLIPFAAVTHRLRGTWRWRRGLGGHVPSWPPPVRAVLFDRDGTLVRDVPYNGDPDAVEPMPGARRLLDGLRTRGLRVGVVSNQSGIGRGLLTGAQVDAVDERVRRLLGPFDTWQRCPHGPEDGCTCRKPEPGLVLRAAGELGLLPAECAVVGDIGSDVGAAIAAGARSVLVPTEVTRREEQTAAPVVAATLDEVVTLL